MNSQIGRDLEGSQVQVLLSQRKCSVPSSCRVDMFIDQEAPVKFILLPTISAMRLAPNNRKLH